MLFHKSSENAFTLIEVLVAIAILSILAVASVPAWQTFITRHHNKELQQLLSRTIDFAAAEARLRNSSVLLSVAPTRITLFIDAENDGLIHNADQIIRQEKINLHHGKLSFRSYPYYRNYLRFSPDPLELMDDASFVYCPAAHSLPTWVMTLSQTGVMSVVEPDNSGVIRDSRQRQFTC